MRIFAVAVAAACAITMFGCSYNKQFSDTLTPLADNITQEMNTYIAALPDGPVKVDESSRVLAFANAVHAGDRDATLPLWFDVPGVRDSYITFLGDDPTLQTAEGQRVLAILYRNVQAVDYLLAIGPKSAAARPPPVAPPPVRPPQ